MALNKALLASSIKQAFLDQLEKKETPQNEVLDDLAEKIANAIEVFVKSGSVSVDVNTTVTGTCDIQTKTISGKGIGTGIGTIS